MHKMFLIVSMSTGLLMGCANPFAQFYFDRTAGNDITKSPAVILPTGEPQVYRGVDPEQDGLKMLEDNFNIVGYSHFNAGNVNENGAIEQAKKVHASVICLYSKYTGSISGAMPMTLPDTTTSTSSLYGNIQGPGGFASYSGNLNTTTYGTKTTYIPYTVHRSDYFATYWIKMKPLRFGVHIRDLPPEVKQRIGSNKGVLIYAVTKGSAAFQADILKGDVLRAIGKVEIIDMDSMQKALAEYDDKEVDIVVIRGDKEIHKAVKLGTRN
jgi:hypothetical protein